MTVGALRFDLSSEAERAKRSGGALFRYISAAALIIVAITIGDQIVTGFLLDRSPLVHEVTAAVVVFLACLVVLCYWAIFYAFSPSATSVELDSRGLTLSYRSGKSVRVLWKNPHLSIVRTYQSRNEIADRYPSEHTTLVGPMGRTNWVTPEVADAILAHTESLGLHARRREKSSGNSRSITIRITT